MSLMVFYEKENNVIAVKSPIVGTVQELPEKGLFLKQEQVIGRIKVLSNFFDLKLPKEISGEVYYKNDEFKIFPVEYRETLFFLKPIETDLNKKELVNNLENNNVEKNQLIIKSTTDGIFYKKPSPDAPPYVSINSEIKKGQTMGLVEVMKCFNPIIFEGIENSERVKIVDICVEDAQEIKANQPLFIVKAL